MSGHTYFPKTVLRQDNQKMRFPNQDHPKFFELSKKGTSALTKVSKQVKKLIVITRGENGAMAIKNDKIIECSAKNNLNIKDLTGAGDLFAAGFLHGYVNKLSLKESLEKGTELSSKIIQQVGARF